MRGKLIKVNLLSEKQMAEPTIGRDGVMQMISGEANGPISPRTSARSSFTSSSSSSVFDSVTVAKATIASPEDKDIEIVGKPRLLRLRGNTEKSGAYP